MKIFETDQNRYLTVDFENADAEWSLLVIDDMWARPRAMIFGGLNKVTGNTYPGIGEGCLNYTILRQYAEQRGVPGDNFDRVLLFIPWMVHGTPGYGSVTISDFLKDTESLRKMFATLEQARSPLKTRRWAVMIDVQDRRLGTGVESVRFEEIWEMLDQVGHPPYARAMITRGGVVLPPWTNKVHKILKESPGEDEEHKRLIQDWLLKVQGAIDDNEFQKLTGTYCHDPSGLEHSTFEQRKRICDTLARPDPYGVWRWARVSVGKEVLASDAAHRWLAAKSFQKTLPDENEVPVTALIAICEGANFLYEGIEHGHKPQFSVDSELRSVSESRIDRLEALGVFHLSSGGYEKFAQALRHWLTLTEQFEEGNARICEVRIERTSGGGQLCLGFTFTGGLPRAIFSPQPHDRVGRATRAWQQLEEFAGGADVDSNPSVALRFDHKS